MFVERDINKGEMTFGERMRLGDIIASDMKDHEKFEEIMELLHGFKPKPNMYKKYVKYVSGVINGIIAWREREERELYIPPTPEEIQAGCEKFSQEVGKYSTLVNISMDFGKNPEEVLEWKYPTVYMILKYNTEKEKFRRRFEKVCRK